MNKNIKIIFSISVVAVIASVIFLGFTFHQNKINEKSNIVQDYEATIEMVEEFLSLLVGDSHNFLLDYNSMDDDRVFISTIRYLVLSEKYSKTNHVYTFNQSDIEECAKNIFNRDDFTFQIKDSNFVYDNDSRTVSSALEFGLFPTREDRKATKIINYTIGDNIISVRYDLYSVEDGTSQAYEIELVYNTGKFRLISVSPVVSGLEKGENEEFALGENYPHKPIVATDKIIDVAYSMSIRFLPLAKAN